MAFATTSLQGRPDEQRSWDLHLGRPGGLRGRSSSNREPRPTSESRSIRPPSAVESSFAIASPSPVPPAPETNGRKSRSRSSAGIPGPVSSTATLDRPVRRASSRLIRAAVRRRAERVREQVADDLEHAVAVGDDHRARADLDAVVDRAPPRLVAERLVGLLDELLHVDLLAQDGEAVGVELREVEDVADEPLEPPRLRLDDLERARRAAPDPRPRPRAAPRRGRGSRSAACAARARPTSGSCARAPRPRRAGRPSRRTARRGGRSRRLRASRDLDLVVAPRDLVGGAREREHGPDDPRARGTTRAPPATRRPSAPAMREPRGSSGSTLLVDVRLLLRDDDRADRPALRA